MSKSYDLVVFDWEGTLGDMLGQILNTLFVEAKRFHLGEVDQMRARHAVPFGLVMAVKKIFPQLSTYQQEQLLEAVQHSLAKAPVNDYLFPGANEIIKQIHQSGIDLAIATNKSQTSLQRALKRLDLEQFFTITRSAGQVPAKPCPQMLEEIMAVCDVSASKTLMVGDSVTDIEMAKHIHVDAVGVDFYHQQTDSLREAGAVEVFDDYQQLADYLGLLK